MHKIVCHQRGTSPKSSGPTYLQYISVQYIQYITLQYITLHYGKVQYITLPVVFSYCIPRCTTPSLDRSPRANRWKNDDYGLVPIFKKYFKKKSSRYAQILTCHYVTKAAFSSFQTIKVTFLILHHFPVIGLPLCLLVVTPRCASPGRWSQCNESFSL